MAKWSRIAGIGVFVLATLGVVAGQVADRAESQAKKPPAMAKELKPASAFAGIADPKARAVALFTEAGKVLSHPRCSNCHSGTRLPRQGDRQRAHRPRAVGGPDGTGVGANKCVTCHGVNADAKPESPKVAKWALAPAGAGFRRRSLGDICRQIRDPKTNGGMDAAALLKHMRTDGLIGWAWKPGSPRTPAPGSQAMFAGLIEAWQKAGAHCPE